MRRKLIGLLIALTLFVAACSEAPPAREAPSAPADGVESRVAETPPGDGLRLTGAQVDLDTTTDAALDRELEALASAGGGSARIPVSWAALEQEGDDRYHPAIVGGGPNLSDEAELDHAVLEAERRGVKPLLTLFLTPCWAVGLEPGCSEEERRRAPTDPSEYGEAAAFLADRYGDRLAGIEVWNEPDLHEFLMEGGATNGPDDKRVRAEIAARLTRAAYDAVKEVSPETAIVAGATEGADAEFIQMMFQAEEGISGHYDAISVHPYTHRFPPSDPRRGSSEGPYPDPAFGGAEHSFVRGVPVVREVMAKNGDADRPIWLTELGWSTCTAVDPAPPNDRNSGGPADTSYRCLSQDPELSADEALAEAEQLQDDFIEAAFAMIENRFAYVEAAFLYELRDSPAAEPPDRNPNCSECRFGVLNRDFSPKRAWASGTVARALATPRR